MTTGTAPAASDHRTVVREALASALYMSLVLLGALAATPPHRFPSDQGVVKLMFGTAIGLTSAHWLAFRLASRATTKGSWERDAAQEAAAQIGGGVGVAVVSALPFAVLDGTTAAAVSCALLGALLAGVGMVVARLNTQPWWRALLAACGVLVVAAVVVFVKSRSH